MSTFFGGETIVNVETINGNSNVGQTVYTVPAGRYAKVFIQRFNSTQDLTIVLGAESFSYTASNPTPYIFEELVLYAGQSISFAVSIGSGPQVFWYLVSREFNLP